MLAGELINRAWNLAGIVPRDLDEVSGSQGADGLFWLNQILSEIGMTGRYIPYYTHIQLNLVEGQELYFIPNLVISEVATFNIGSVRYQMDMDNRRHYFGAPRVDNIQALPFNWYWERVAGGTNIYTYFLPQSSTYVLKITGRFSLANVTPFTDLNLTYDLFYQSFLMYLLAQRLCDWYKISLSPDTKLQLQAFLTQLADMNPMDLVLKKTATYSHTDSITYAQANIGKGWTSP